MKWTLVNGKWFDGPFVQMNEATVAGSGMIPHRAVCRNSMIAAVRTEFVSATQKTMLIE